RGGYNPNSIDRFQEIQNSPREKFLFVICSNVDQLKPDMIATVDVDPESSTYCEVISRVDFPNIGDEVHYSGWNTYLHKNNEDCMLKSYLTLPCMNTSRIYIVDVTDPKNLTLLKAIEPEVLFRYNVSFPHASHCLPDGSVMISMLTSTDGDFFLLDGKNFEPIGTWISEGTKKPSCNGDFWYQVKNNIMISTELASPNKFKKGFNLKKLSKGTHLNIWNWKERQLLQQVKLKQPEGLMPYKVRFLHDSKTCQGYVITALGSSLYHFYKTRILNVPSKTVRKWLYPKMPAFFTDMIISLDDKFLYISAWLHGEVRQYNISNPAHPTMISVGGLLHTESPVVFKTMTELKRIEGGAQTLQLSLDGKRLYVNTSLYTTWDLQIQPATRNGTQMVMIDVNTDSGGLFINPDFLVDFGTLRGGPYLGRDMRYPGGDCTSIIHSSR
ncbi:unnamed protein product, partial [Thelazia callipaeda]|uniref:Methanethiol oxidase n=1 Tax=Thelazia callipaeda TaxID=103827 RepID=A0A0N5CP65_THECL